MRAPAFCGRQLSRAPTSRNTKESVFVLGFSGPGVTPQSAAFIRGNEEHAFSCCSVPDRACCRLRALLGSAPRVGVPQAGICLLPSLINWPFYAI